MVDEKAGDTARIEDAGGTGGGGVAGGAAQAFGGGVVEEDLLIAFSRAGVAVVVAGERTAGHKGEVAAVRGGAGGKSAEPAPKGSGPVGSILAGEDGEEAAAVG